jgi:hypothetical protein
MVEKLCLWCQHFCWTKESMWGMGSTMTGPMMEGGDFKCEVGHKWDVWQPDDQEDWRKVVVKAQTCPDYEQIDAQNLHTMPGSKQHSRS